MLFYLKRNRWGFYLAALILGLVLAAFFLSFPAVADGTVSLTIGSVNNAKPGDTISVPISITENSGACMVQFTLKYDTDKLSLINAIAGSVLSSPTINATNAGYVGLAWENTEPATTGGTILNLTFRINDGVNGNASVVFDDTEDFIFYDYNFEEISVQKSTGTVSITATQTPILSSILGDVNGDGEIDRADRTYLARYLAGWQGYEIDEAAADVNQDGEVDRADRTYLARYLAGWSGYTL